MSDVPAATVLIVDCGTGNLRSIVNMLKRVGVSSVVSADPVQVANAAKLILPGVGAFDNGMRTLEKLGLIDALHASVIERRVPTLGICLGMQLMANRSEEGTRKGLGWIDGETVRLTHARIPHMGWNSTVIRKSSRLFYDLGDEPNFYFMHSYHVRLLRSEDQVSATTYGDEFSSALEKNNILGVQFHPEKSHKYGMKLLRNFTTLY